MSDKFNTRYFPAMSYVFTLKKLVLKQLAIRFYALTNPSRFLLHWIKHRIGSLIAKYW